MGEEDIIFVLVMHSNSVFFIVQRNLYITLPCLVTYAWSLTYDMLMGYTTREDSVWWPEDSHEPYFASMWFVSIVVFVQNSHCVRYMLPSKYGMHYNINLLCTS